MDKTLITQDRKERIRYLDLGGGLVSGDGGNNVMEIEELEKQAQPKSGRTQLWSTARSLQLEACCHEQLKNQTHILIIFFLLTPLSSLFFDMFPNPGTTRSEHHQ